MVKKILVIEDGADTRNFFVECLKAEGFYAIGAKNGRLGVQQVQEQLPDLIICDIIMPELDGYGVLNEVRQDPAIANIPFIFLTAKATRADLRQGMELGADDYLPKPCTVDELLRAIATQLKKQTIRQWCVAQYQRVSEPLTSIATPQLIFPSVRQLKEVFDFIEANYRRPITLHDVAQVVGYSRCYLTDLVRRQTGKTVYRWIVERRIAEACSLLLETNQTVDQIAETVGYQDASHFFRQFRQLYGTTPHVWRTSHHRVHNHSQFG